MMARRNAMGTGTTLHYVQAEGRYDDRVKWRHFLERSTTDR